MKNRHHFPRSSTKMMPNGGLKMSRKILCAEIYCDLHNEKLTKNDEKWQKKKMFDFTQNGLWRLRIDLLMCSEVFFDCKSDNTFFWFFVKEFKREVDFEQYYGTALHFCRYLSPYTSLNLFLNSFRNSFDEKEKTRNLATNIFFTKSNRSKIRIFSKIEFKENSEK